MRVLPYRSSGLQSFCIDHVIARQHGGKTALDNLAFSCLHCNALKGPNVAGTDQQKGQLVRLFDPRKDDWTEHFAWSGAMLIGIHLKRQDRTVLFSGPYLRVLRTITDRVQATGVIPKFACCWRGFRAARLPTEQREEFRAISNQLFRVRQFRSVTEYLSFALSFRPRRRCDLLGRTLPALSREDVPVADAVALTRGALTQTDSNANLVRTGQTSEGI